MGEAERSFGEADPGLSPALARTTFSASGEAAGKLAAPVFPAAGLSTCSLPAGMGWKPWYADPATSRVMNSHQGAKIAGLRTLTCEDVFGTMPTAEGACQETVSRHACRRYLSQAAGLTEALSSAWGAIPGPSQCCCCCCWRYPLPGGGSQPAAGAPSGR